MTTTSSTKRGKWSVPLTTRPTWQGAFLRNIYIYLDDGHIVLEEQQEGDRWAGFEEVMRVTPHKSGMVEFQKWFCDKGHRSARLSNNLEFEELVEDAGFNRRFQAKKWVMHALSWVETGVVGVQSR